MISALKAFCAIAGQKNRPRTFSIADANPASDNPTRNGDIHRVSETVSAYFSALSVNPSAIPRTSSGAPNQNSSTEPPSTQSSTPSSALASRHAPSMPSFSVASEKAGTKAFCRLPSASSSRKSCGIRMAA